jgi:hypothetical protein
LDHTLEISDHDLGYTGASAGFGRLFVQANREPTRSVRPRRGQTTTRLSPARHRVPQEVADQRRQRIRETYRKQGRQPSEKMLQLAEWTLVLTNVPVTLLSLQEALCLLKVRWQIELLFKLWKDYLAMDKWNSQNPWRILTEIYAKLLTALLFHWTTLFDFWSYPDRSLFKAVRVFQKYITSILFHLSDRPALITLLQRLSDCYAKACRIGKHADLACTFQMLLDPSLR